MQTRDMFIVAALALLTTTAKGGDTNSPSAALTNALPAAMRTAAQVEKELSAVLDAELKGLKIMMAEVEQIRTGLDKDDASWHPQAEMGPPAYNYLGALRARREVLREELYSIRMREVGKIPRQSAQATGTASQQTIRVPPSISVIRAEDDPEAAFIIGVLATGLTNQVSIHHVGPLPERDEGQKQTVQLDLRIEGTLEHISGFLRNVTANSAVVVEDVKLHEQAGQLSGSVRLSAVFLRE